jgi:tetratricopeptide (TPR) repeat protein
LWRALRGASPERQVIARGLLAGIVGWLGQMIVDDFSGWITVMVPILMLAAWLGTAGQAPLARRQKISFGWLWLAVLALFAYSAWDLWTFKPMGAALQAERQGDWRAAAYQLTLAAERDPTLNLYAAEAGLAWSMVYRETGDLAALSEARAWLQAAAEREPQFSLLKANLAVLEWQAGDREQAIQTMTRAAEQAPFEASFSLNLCWMLEETGRDQEAVIRYVRALELAPRLAQHVFWTQSSARRQAREMWMPVIDAKAPVYLPQVSEAFAAGDLTEAQRLLALARATNEDGSQVNYWRGRLAEAEGGPEAAIQAYLSVRAGLEMPIFWTTSNFSFGYTRWGYNRPGLLVDLVPGFGQLVGSEETWDGMKRLHAIQVLMSDCDEAAHTWEVWQKAVTGGFPGQVPPPPVCP